MPRVVPLAQAALDQWQCRGARATKEGRESIKDVRMDGVRRGRWQRLLSSAAAARGGDGRSGSCWWCSRQDSGKGTAFLALAGVELGPAPTVHPISLSANLVSTSARRRSKPFYSAPHPFSTNMCNCTTAHSCRARSSLRQSRSSGPCRRAVVRLKPYAATMGLGEATAVRRVWMAACALCRDSARIRVQQTATPALLTCAVLDLTSVVQAMPVLGFQKSWKPWKPACQDVSEMPSFISNARPVQGGYI